MKPVLAQQIERSRRARKFRKGAKVLYPVPLPPVAHNPDEDGVISEIAVPVGHEEWLPAAVVGIEHQERTTDPDGYLAILDKGDGLIDSLSVTFLRPA